MICVEIASENDSQFKTIQGYLTNMYGTGNCVELFFFLLFYSEKITEK